MSTTKETLKNWFLRGLENKDNTHMIVAVDTWDYEDYPIYVNSSQDIKEEVVKVRLADMQRVMEVYNLRLDMKVQVFSNGLAMNF